MPRRCCRRRGALLTWQGREKDGLWAVLCWLSILAHHNAATPVGKLVGVQGLQGELRVNPASDFPERFTTPGSRWLRSRKGGEPREIHLREGRQLPGKSLYIVRLEGVERARRRQREGAKAAGVGRLPPAFFLRLSSTSAAVGMRTISVRRHECF